MHLHPYTNDVYIYSVHNHSGKILYAIFDRFFKAFSNGTNRNTVF